MAGFRSQIEAIHRGDQPPAAYDARMGFRFRSLEPGRAVVECPDAAGFQNPTLVVHGGLLFGLADSAIAYALSTQLEDGETCTTIESSIHFLRPLQSGRAVAEARVVRAGRTICLLDCEIKDAEGVVLARVTSTFLRMKGRQDATWLEPSVPGRHAGQR